ncbi:acyl-CoA dehydrogenase [Nocardioides eburneiflavus]|uniref:Acyl-CoA dehydrogenase n=1 Tax=Nocardioides eburneiflavus TaxID=2518372 RepID=A0A4Z1C8G8_9ACTN|nr:acyl-CoA dehydrogenase family protein [Nocardioides eburneiflavus]TGN66072.1 acyl-CoA dehydrogenase [Nocardioides eburneiflavus]
MSQPWPESDPALLAPVEEHDELRSIVRQVLAKHADHEQVRTSADSALGWSADLWGRLNGELEIGGLAVPEALGGAGFGVREIAVVLEEAGASLLPEPVLASAVLGCRALAAADDAAGVAHLRATALSGESVLTVSLAAGLDAEVGEDSWLLTGSVAGVLQAESSDHVVVVAGTDAGPGLFLVAREHCSVTPRRVVDLTRRQADVALASAPATQLVAAPRAEVVIADLRRLTLVALAAEHAGIAARLLDLTCEYVVQRQQFGRAIGSFQAVKHRLADVLVDRERALSAARYAAALLDSDADPHEADLAASVAAAVCQDAALRAAHETIQLHGGIGFTWEHRAHYYLRRVLGDEGVFGSSREHRAAIADLVGV